MDKNDMRSYYKEDRRRLKNKNVAKRQGYRDRQIDLGEYTEGQ